MRATELRRWWDGRTRTVTSVRHVKAGITSMRVEMLSCGHEKVFDSNGIPAGRLQHRVCLECPEPK